MSRFRCDGCGFVLREEDGHKLYEGKPAYHRTRGGENCEGAWRRAEEPAFDSDEVDEAVVHAIGGADRKLEAELAAAHARIAELEAELARYREQVATDATLIVDMRAALARAGAG